MGFTEDELKGMGFSDKETLSIKLSSLEDDKTLLQSDNKRLQRLVEELKQENKKLKAKLVIYEANNEK